MTLAESFISGRGAPVLVDGRSVLQMYRRAVAPNERFQLNILRARETPVQGACLKLSTGMIGIAEQTLERPVLWLDTIPTKSIELRCISKKASELRIWNCWRNHNDVTDAWTGNAGIIVEEVAHGRVQLRCNSALELTFADLVLELVPLG